MPHGPCRPFTGGELSEALLALQLPIAFQIWALCGSLIFPAAERPRENVGGLDAIAGLGAPAALARM